MNNFSRKQHHSFVKLSLRASNDTLRLYIKYFMKFAFFPCVYCRMLLRKSRPRVRRVPPTVRGFFEDPSKVSMDIPTSSFLGKIPFPCWKICSLSPPPTRQLNNLVDARKFWPRRALAELTIICSRA